MERLELTILMPCLNEENTIGECIEKARRYISDKGIEAEILIADNGSTDDSVKIAKKLGARVIKIKKKGYGNALRAGIKAAHGKYVIMGDCDGSYDFYHIDEFVDNLRSGCDLVVGNRLNKYMEKGAMPFTHKYLGVPVLSVMGRIRYKTNVRDFHCGLSGVRRDDAIGLSLNSPGMEFATEIIAAFAGAKLPIAQVNVRFRKDMREGKSHLRTIRDGFRHLRYMLFTKYVKKYTFFD